MTDFMGRGTYILWLYAAVPTVVEVGKLGLFPIADGWYGYIGSAMGSGGLRGRLRHHLSPIRRPHWHIDYLRQTATVEQIWAIADDQPYEHLLAARLRQMPGATIPIPRFGASDCRCESHLYYFSAPPRLAAFQAVLNRNTRSVIMSIFTAI